LEAALSRESSLSDLVFVHYDPVSQSAFDDDVAPIRGSDALRLVTVPFPPRRYGTIEHPRVGRVDRRITTVRLPA
jgi:hypothetical protein